MSGPHVFRKTLRQGSHSRKPQPYGKSKDEGSMLMSLHKSMQASYNLYNKTRPSASKSSVARAKKLLEECGGAAQLQSMLHPSFSVETAKEHGYQPGGGISTRWGKRLWVLAGQLSTNPPQK